MLKTTPTRGPTEENITLKNMLLYFFQEYLCILRAILAYKMGLIRFLKRYFPVTVTEIFCQSKT